MTVPKKGYLSVSTKDLLETMLELKEGCHSSSVSACETGYEGSSDRSPMSSVQITPYRSQPPAEFTQALRVYFRVTAFSAHAAGLGTRE